MSPTIIDTTSFELVSLHPANPAAAASYVFVIPANTVILPIAVTFTYTTDANVADRRVAIFGGPSGAFWSMSLADTVQTASLVMTYHFTLDQTAPFYSAAAHLAQYPLQPELYLYPNDHFMIYKYNVQAADALTAIYWGYKRWILQ